MPFKKVTAGATCIPRNAPLYFSPNIRGCKSYFRDDLSWKRHFRHFPMGDRMWHQLKDHSLYCCNLLSECVVFHFAFRSKSGVKRSGRCMGESEIGTVEGLQGRQKQPFLVSCLCIGLRHVDDIYEMNFTLCVLLVYNDNGSVQTLCITRVSALCTKCLHRPIVIINQ